MAACDGERDGRGVAWGVEVNGNWTCTPLHTYLSPETDLAALI